MQLRLLLFFFLFFNFWTFPLRAQVEFPHSISAGFSYHQVGVKVPYDYFLHNNFALPTKRSSGYEVNALMGQSLHLSYTYQRFERWAFGANMHYGAGKDTLFKNRTIQLNQVSIPLMDIAKYRLFWTDAQVYWKALDGYRKSLEIGTGLSYTISRLKYRSSLEYNTAFEQISVQRFTKKRQVSLGIPLSFRFQLELFQRLRLTVNLANHFLFKEGYILEGGFQLGYRF